MTRCFASDTPPSRYSRRHAVELKVSVCAPFGVRTRFCQVLSTFRVSEERRQEGQQADQREQHNYTKKKMRESMVESLDSFYSEIHAVCAYIPCSALWFLLLLAAAFLLKNRSLRLISRICGYMRWSNFTSRVPRCLISTLGSSSNRSSCV